MNNIINTPQNNPKIGSNQQFQSQQKKARENNIYKDLVAQCSSKTIDNPKGVLLKNNGPIKGLAVGIADTGKDIVNLTRALGDGKTNDHSLGRMNDLGLKIGGLGIAAYLMTKKGPKTGKMMEFVGLGTFLATMTLWPRVFVDLPLRLRYGFNIRQKYKDSQGRKKEFFQDNQYLPWDLWPQQKIKKVGDKMGIPRNIKDRDEFTKRNMQKVALQGNTLWMLTAGFATPLVTSMVCRETEKALERMNIERQYKKATGTIESAEAITRGAESRARSMNPFSKIFKNFTARGEGATSWVDRLVKAFSPIGNDSNFPDADSARVFNVVVNSSQSRGQEIQRIWEENVKKNIVEDSTLKKLSEIFKGSVPVVDEMGTESVYALSETDITAIIRNAQSGDQNLEFGEALSKAFSGFLEKKGLSLSEASGNSIKGLSGEGLMSLDERPAVGILSETYDDVIRIVKAKLDIVQEAINATMGNRAESVTTQAYIQTLQDVLGFINPNMKQLKEARESSAKAYELVVGGLQEIGQDDARYEAFIKGLANPGSSSGNWFSRLGSKITGIFRKPKATATANERLEETMKRVQENGYSALEDSAVELRKRGFTTYAGLFERGGDNSANSIFTAFDNTMEQARINLNSTRARYLMATDFEKRLQDPGFKAKLESIARERAINPDTCIETCRRIMYCDNMNDFMVKNSMFDQRAYYDILDALFDSELNPKTLEILQTGGHGDLLRSVNETRENMLKTGKGAQFHPMPQLWSDHDFKAAMPGESHRYTLFGETIPDFFSKAANETYKDKKWIRIFGTATLALIGVTLLSQLFFGRRNDKKLYEKKEVENGNKR